MTRHLPFHVALAFTGALGVAAAARADWPTDGLGVCTEPSNQTQPALATDGAGGAFIAWVDARTPDQGIYVQRVTSGGELAAGWPADGLFLSPPTSGISPPSVAEDGSGGAFVAWAGSFAILLQRVTSSGAIAPGWPADGLLLANTSPWLEFAVVVPDGAGGALVAWSNDASANIRVQRVTGGGTLAPGWVAGGIPVSASGGTFSLPVLVADGAGGAIVAWSHLGVGSGDIYAQRIAANGSRANGWPEDGLVVCGAAGAQQDPRITADGQGGAYLAWRDERNLSTTGADLYLLRFTSEGAVAPGWPADGLAVCTAAGNQQNPRPAADGTGGVIVSWRDRRTDPDGDVYAQRLTGTGGVVTGWPSGGALVCEAPGEQLPAVAGTLPDGAGGALVVWRDARDSGTTGMDIYVQRLGSDGAIAPGWPAGGIALCAASGSQTFPRAVSNGAGGAIVGWEDGREGAGNTDIYAARINPDGSTPVLLSLVSAEARAGAVYLHWHAAGSPGLAATLERRTPETEWVARGVVTADRDGNIAVVDHEVIGGGRYGYRLAIVEQGVERFLGEAWVTIPGVTDLSLAAAWDAAARAWDVALSLPGDAPATLELFDLRGARLEARRLQGLGPGRHRLALVPRGSPRAGVHFLRLTQGPDEARARAILLR